MASDTTQQLEPPSETDLVNIAKLQNYAQHLVSQMADVALTGSLEDLATLQEVVLSSASSEASTPDLQSLGIAFGRVIATNNPEYDWWMVKDELGRDPCLRYLDTQLLIFPQTMISKRIEDGEAVDITQLYHSTMTQLNHVIAEHFS